MFAELRDIDILTERLNVLNTVQPYIGSLFSNKWVRQKLMRFTDEEIDELDAEIKAERGENSIGPEDPDDLYDYSSPQQKFNREPKQDEPEENEDIII